MKKNSTLLVGILICLAVIGLSYIWATSLMASVYAYRSPLHSSAPLPGGQLGSPNTRTFVVVLIDALRYDTSTNSNVMPFLNELRSQGASALMHSRPPSYSEPGYTVILTGAWPDISDGPAINLDYAEIPTFTQDDIFSAAHRAGLKTAVSGFNWFEKLIPQQAVTASFYTAGEDKVADRDVTNAALPWLKDGSYSLVLIHLDQVDYAGHHEGGPIDPRWNEAASRADGLLKEIVSGMDLTQDTLLVISDHGQIDRGGHGGQDTIVLKEPFVLAGKGVIAGKYNDVQMVDITPTIATFLGTNIPASNEGHPLIDMLDISLPQVDRVKSALAKQQAGLAVAYQTAIGKPVIVNQSEDVVAATQTALNAAQASRLNGERIIRGVLAIVAGVLLLNLAAWGSKPYLTWNFLGVIAYLVIFQFKYLLLDHKTYSLSSVTSATNLITSSAITTLVALVIAWLLVLLGSRAYRLKARQGAEVTLKFILFTLSVLAIPVLIHYAVNGATVTWALPNFLLSFLGVLFLIQTLIVAVLGLILTGFSALIGIFARVK